MRQVAMMTMMLIMMKDKSEKRNFTGVTSNMGNWPDLSFKSSWFILYEYRKWRKSGSKLRTPSKQALLTATELIRNKGEDTQQCPVVDPRKTENYQYPSSGKFSLHCQFSLTGLLFETSPDALLNSCLNLHDKYSGRYNRNGSRPAGQSGAQDGLFSPNLDTKGELDTHVNIAGHLDHLRELDRFLCSTLKVLDGEDPQAGVIDLRKDQISERNV